jgi:hypothetical protein
MERLGGNSFNGVLGLVLSINREEEMVMGLTILIVITVLGLMMPFFWIIGTVTGITYYCLHGEGKTRKERTAAFNPQLGLTMADGGDPVDKKEK